MGGYGSGARPRHRRPGDCEYIDTAQLHGLPSARAATIRDRWSTLYAVGLVTTRPHYGGERFWFEAPCCGRRVRILYLKPGTSSQLACRVCLDLRFESQGVGIIEKRKTYERYLLRNGSSLAWAIYQALPVHYLSEAEREAAFQFGYEWVIVRGLRFAIAMWRLVASCSRDEEVRGEALAAIADINEHLQQLEEAAA